MYVVYTVFSGTEIKVTSFEIKNFVYLVFQVLFEEPLVSLHKCYPIILSPILTWLSDMRSV